MIVAQSLWFQSGMEEALQLYTSLVPNSRIQSIRRLPGDSPVTLAEFSLGGQQYMAMECAGPDSFNRSFSIMLLCDSQEEVDRLWAALGEGGVFEDCGWLKDRWGVSWQITSRKLCQVLTSPGDEDEEKRRRAIDVMNTMTKTDVAQIEAAVEDA